MRKLIEIRPPDGNVDVFEADDVELFYADGVGAVQLMQYNCKLDFFVSEPVETNEIVVKLGGANAGGKEMPPERRVVRHRAVIPTAQFIEMMIRVATLLSTEEASLKKNFEAQGVQFFEAVRKLTSGLK